MSQVSVSENSESSTARSASSLRKVFIGEKGIRSGWRLVMFLLLLVASTSLFRLVLTRIPQLAHFSGQKHLSVSLEYLVEIPTALCALLSALIMARIEKRTLADYGLRFQRGTGRQFSLGLVWGLASFSAMILVIALWHGFSPGTLALHGLVLLKYTILWAIAFLLVGFVEEFLFRGYVQFTLSEAIGFWPSAVIWSLAFGAIHLANPGENLAGVSEVFLFAIFACLTLRRTGALWFAIGSHAAGDFAETFLFSVPDSGYTASGVLLHSSFHGPKWLTGGSVGPEASVFSLLMLCIAITLFHFLYPSRNSRPPARFFVGADTNTL